MYKRQDLGDLLVVQARENLDVIPSDKTTEPAKRILASMDFRERILADALEELAEGYDVAVIDCAPSVDVLHVAALVAADRLVVPTKLDYLAVDGVNEVLASLAEIKRRSSAAPDLLGVLPTFFDRQTNGTLVQLKTLVNAFGRHVLPPIPVDTRLREAPAYGQTIWEYAPRSRSVVGVVNGKLHKCTVPSVSWQPRSRSVVSVTNGKGNPVGGYVQFVERIKEVLR